MESSGFKVIRTRFGKTQKALAQLLGVSVKAVHSYEQGWRKIPHHVERQLLFLLSRTMVEQEESTENCWEKIDCPDKKNKKCPAREFKAGNMCWFINGTLCNGKPHATWEEKMNVCKACSVYKDIFE